MATPHNTAEYGDIAKTVIMPGDPLRAKYIAENFLEDVKMFNQVRNMLGFTGKYKGKEVSVMGHGMGMPSMGIYSYELFSIYGVDNIIRVGSSGAYTDELGIYDVVLGDSSYSESNYALVESGYDKHITYPSEKLNEKIIETAKEIGKKIKVGRIYSSDVFYREDKTPFWKRYNKEHGCICVEMESFALFHNATVLGKNAACLLTIADSFLNTDNTSAEEREKTFVDMMEIALETAIKL